MIHRHRGNRRRRDYLKAKRKIKIVHDLNDYWYYKYPGMYIKGKIHCSCPMCAAKTNGTINKSKGPVDVQTRRYGDKEYTHIVGDRIPCTNHRLGKKNWKMSDAKKIESMKSQEREYIDLIEYA